MLNESGFKPGSRILLLVLIAGVMFNLPLKAQWSEEWSRTYAGDIAGNCEATSIAVDNNGNAWVTGMAIFCIISYT